MEVQQDFKDLLALFNEYKVEYMIVKGDSPRIRNSKIGQFWFFILLRTPL